MYAKERCTKKKKKEKKEGKEKEKEKEKEKRKKERKKNRILTSIDLAKVSANCCTAGFAPV
jgi:hypothetical protein